jgi:hypothetical protein
MCTGEYSCPGCLARLIEKYQEIRKTKQKAQKRTDVAGVDSYVQETTWELGVTVSVFLKEGRDDIHIEHFVNVASCILQHIYSSLTI